MFRKNEFLSGTICMEDCFYSIREVAALLGTSQKNIRRYVASGELETVKKGCRYFIPEGGIEAFRKYIESSFSESVRETFGSEKRLGSLSGNHQTTFK